MRTLVDFLQFIRVSHTIFALPFALGAMFVAADGIPTWPVVVGIVVAMICARTAAMAFNRFVDWEIDKRNPRTANRQQLATRRTALVMCLLAAGGFVLSAWWLNPLCFLLSPAALGIIFFYSFTKRFTHLAQFFLGLSLSIAPVGAWLAVTGTFAWPPLVLALAVLFWVTGFDLIYATQDYEVDCRDGLHSMVVYLGIPDALRLAVWLHLFALLGLVAFGLMANMEFFYFASLGIILLALIYEHMEARRGNVTSINRAFFQANAIVGLAFIAGTLLDRLVV